MAGGGAKGGVARWAWPDGQRGGARGEAQRDGKHPQNLFEGGGREQTPIDPKGGHRHHLGRGPKPDLGAQTPLGVRRLSVCVGGGHRGIFGGRKCPSPIPEPPPRCPPIPPSPDRRTRASFERFFFNLGPFSGRFHPKTARAPPPPPLPRAACGPPNPPRGSPPGLGGAGKGHDPSPIPQGPPPALRGDPKGGGGETPQSGGGRGHGDPPTHP